MAEARTHSDSSNDGMTDGDFEVGLAALSAATVDEVISKLADGDVDGGGTSVVSCSQPQVVQLAPKPSTSVKKATPRLSTGKHIPTKSDVSKRFRLDRKREYLNKYFKECFRMLDFVKYAPPPKDKHISTLSIIISRFLDLENYVNKILDEQI